jgi:asparagine synthase (glutamine-hydrolysing)
MCGILGYAGPRVEQERHAFEAALDLLQHRGPDDRGVFGSDGVLLGHRRLSIIDLSTAGHQPMVDADSGAVVTYNGEIYNYLELRQELESRGHRFRSATDTEVLLKAYLEWGPGCLGRLNGMWAFAVWIPARQTLFCARDRFGVKPFYLWRNSSSIAFASEPKAILALRPETRRVDESTLAAFLGQSDLYTGDRSFYEGIRVLPPAHCAQWSAATGDLRMWRYWNYPSEPARLQSPQHEIATFTALLDDAVRIRLRSDVPVGLTLSGGLDSTAVLTGAMKSGSQPLACFTSVYSSQERGEAGWAQRAAAPYGIQPIEVEATESNWLDTSLDISWHMDGPGSSQAVYPLWFVMREARARAVPVLLEGQGADELLGGYSQHAVLALLREVRAVTTRPNRNSVQEMHLAWRRLVRTFTLRWAVLWTLREAFPGLLGLYRRRSTASAVMRPELAVHLPPDRFGLDAPPWTDPLSRRLLDDHSRGVLPGLLHYGDAISMAHGIESRLPFMDYRLVEHLFARSSELKVRQGETKWLVREYLRRNGQRSIGERPDKLAYPTPLEHWLVRAGGATAKEVLLQPGALIHTYCEPSRIDRLIRMHVAGRAGAGYHVYRLVSTELWLRTCIAAQGRAPQCPHALSTTR